MPRGKGFSTQSILTDTLNQTDESTLILLIRITRKTLKS